MSIGQRLTASLGLGVAVLVCELFNSFNVALDLLLKFFWDLDMMSMKEVAER